MWDAELFFVLNGHQRTFTSMKFQLLLRMLPSKLSTLLAFHPRRVLTLPLRSSMKLLSSGLSIPNNHSINLFLADSFRAAVGALSWISVSLQVGSLLSFSLLVLLCSFRVPTTNLFLTGSLSLSLSPRLVVALIAARCRCCRCCCWLRVRSGRLSPFVLTFLRAGFRHPHCYG